MLTQREERGGGRCRPVSVDAGAGDSARRHAKARALAPAGRRWWSRGQPRATLAGAAAQSSAVSRETASQPSNLGAHAAQLVTIRPDPARQRRRLRPARRRAAYVVLAWRADAAPPALAPSTVVVREVDPLTAG
jgi:hypothetical protein